MGKRLFKAYEKGEWGGDVVGKWGTLSTFSQWEKVRKYQIGTLTLSLATQTPFLIK